MRNVPLVTAASFLHRGEAELARVRLSAAGVDAVVRADDEGGLSPGFFTDFRVRVEVRVRDLADALETLGLAFGHVEIAPEALEAMLAHTRYCAPLEACGLLATGGDHRVTMVYALSNAEASPVRYTVDPGEHLGAIRHAERQGWEITGGFHSHPSGPAVPSSRDVARAGDPRWLHLVVAGRRPEVRGYRIAGGTVEEVALRIR